ncbi:hypothetical protein [Ferribacterium limneticum]|uniref:hypothetical protein n=1 Tax=Ferribacterium limneticum TaxID=76259 RepID=UPI001CFA02C4|nr:hypothetical protein [Ferribacterium limneticum]UCV28087.1 hypothetical protein KI617_17880 [Ferribacterium limneticum]UCV32004.1 hypothetical protein KI608_17880 [Ferribacterium limneticum]
MNIRLGAVIVGLAVSLAGCSSAPSRPPFKGQPSVEVNGIAGDEIQSRFSVNCLDGGGKVVQSSQFSLTCATPMGSSMREMMFRALLTEKYASNPEITVQLAWAKLSAGKMKVTATAWLEHQNAFGKSTRDSLDADATKYELQGALDTFKKNVETEVLSKK